MDTRNYTPLQIEKGQKKVSRLDIILLVVATFTALILAVLLFMLVQRPA